MKTIVNNPAQSKWQTKKWQGGMGGRREMRKERTKVDISGYRSTTAIEILIMAVLVVLVHPD